MNWKMVANLPKVKKKQLMRLTMMIILKVISYWKHGTYLGHEFPWDSYVIEFLYWLIVDYIFLDRRDSYNNLTLSQGSQTLIPYDEFNYPTIALLAGFMNHTIRFNPDPESLIRYTLFLVVHSTTIFYVVIYTWLISQS